MAHSRQGLFSLLGRKGGISLLGCCKSSALQGKSSSSRREVMVAKSLPPPPHVSLHCYCQSYSSGRTNSCSRKGSLSFPPREERRNNSARVPLSKGSYQREIVHLDHHPFRVWQGQGHHCVGCSSLRLGLICFKLEIFNLWFVLGGWWGHCMSSYWWVWGTDQAIY